MKQRAILFFFIGIMTGILQAQTLTLKDAGQLFLKQNLSLIARSEERRVGKECRL